MKLYVVYFGVEYGGASLDGVFSTIESARAQIELSKKAHNFYGKNWYPDQFEADRWVTGDLSLFVVEMTLDELKYENF